MNDEKRYCTIEKSLIEACKEVNLMRKGLKPEPTLDELWAEFDKILDEVSENNEEV